MTNLPEEQLTHRPNVTNIAHLGTVCSDCPPVPKALCGAKIQGVQVEGGLDCLVCAEMSRLPRSCETCGIPLEGW